MNARLLVVLLAACLLQGEGRALADTPVVYDDNTGPEGATPFTSTLLIPLRIDMGTDLGTGTPCVDSDGDHLCAADVVITVSGPASISSFSEGANVVFEPSHLPGTELRMNLLQAAVPPLVPGPQDLGILTIDRDIGASLTEPVKVDVSGQAVDAAGALVTIPTRTIAVPEPSGTASLLNGLLGLALLHWFRARGTTRLACARPNR
ncbi:MAG: hypothetical protein JRG92_06550 [Deltaproteobacteria bacterium]|nr:hypothetical protein [Deltaproteobacteria bacterium]